MARMGQHRKMKTHKGQNEQSKILQRYLHQLTNQYQGQIQDFKSVGGGALKIIVRREHFWGILCEKSRFYAKIIFFPILGGCATDALSPPPFEPPLNIHVCLVSSRVFAHDSIGRRS